MPEDFSKPGNDGGTVPEEPETVVKVHVSDNSKALPRPLECGKPYFVRIVLSESVTDCATYNLESAWTNAYYMARNRIAELDCPSDCSPPHEWTSLQSWECSKLANYARVVVVQGVLCPRAGQARPGGLARPSTEAFAEWNFEQTDEERKQIEEWRQEGHGPYLRCPSSRLFRIEFEADAPSCDGLDYTAYVREAEARADFYFSQIACGGFSQGCTKHKHVVRREWLCICKPRHGPGLHGRGLPARLSGRNTVTSRTIRRQARRLT
jgi:hypothetical protein